MKRFSLCSATIKKKKIDDPEQRILNCPDRGGQYQRRPEPDLAPFCQQQKEQQHTDDAEGVRNQVTENPRAGEKQRPFPAQFQIEFFPAAAQQERAGGE